MTKRFKLLLVLFFLVFSAKIYAETENTWVLATENFKIKSSTQRNKAVLKGVADMFPARIMEKMNSTYYRIIDDSELNGRRLIELKKERTSLALQLSSAVKKRDALVLGNYTQKELQEKIAEEEIKIQEIKDKITENLEESKQLQEESLEGNSKKSGQKEKSQDEKLDMTSFVKNLFAEDEEQVVTERVVIYKNNPEVRYRTPLKGADKKYTSKAFEKKIIEENINGLMTGKIDNYDEFYYFTVEVYAYPGAKVIASAMEIGTLEDADFIATSISNQLKPSITNTFPIDLNFFVKNKDAKGAVRFYVDDVLYREIPSTVRLQSGVHSLHLDMENFNACGITYYFAGNKTYNVEFTLEPKITTQFKVFPLEPVYGAMFANGIALDKDELNRSIIRVDGETVLGQLTGEDKTSSFFYVPENMLINNSNYALKLQLENRDEFIEMHRRRMYLSYSILVSSLIPYYYFKGQSQIYVSAYNAGYLTDVRKGNIMIMGSNISAGISIGCGIWFGYELVRYLMAANTVLPVQAEPAPPDFDYSILSIVPVIEDTTEEKTEEDIPEKTEVDESELLSEEDLQDLYQSLQNDDEYLETDNII